MYAVIRTGGKQYRVREGQQLDVERLAPAADGADVAFEPLLVVDGDTVLASPTALAGARVTARVVGESKGPKIDGFRYKNKSNQRRHWGHRQKTAVIEITGITKGAADRASASSSSGG